MRKGFSTSAFQGMKRAVFLFVIILAAVSILSPSSYCGNDNIAPYYVNMGTHYTGSRYCKFGDHNGDGYIDIFISMDYDTLDLYLLEGMGNGQFLDVSPIDLGCDGYGCEADYYDQLLILDFPPHDGLDDIIVVRHTNNYIIYRNNGGNEWIPEEVDRWFPLYGLIGGCDCDEDGNTEVLSISDWDYIPESGNHSIFILPADHQSGWIHVPEDSRSSAAFTSIIETDFNGDGFKDIMLNPQTYMMSYYNLSIYSGSDSCTYSHFANFSTPYGVSERVGDFNNDGCDDIIYTANDFYQMPNAYLAYGGPEGFSDIIEINWRPHYQYEYGIIAADVNCDGFDDGIVQNPKYITENNTIELYIHFSDGDTFSTRIDTLILEDVEQNQRIHVADFNNDGNDDLCYFPTDDSVTVLMSQGPTATLLTSHTATVEGGAVLLNWKLSEAVNKENFRIYRKEDSEQGYIQISATGVTENGNSSYELRDKEVKSGKSYTYRVDLLEESSETKTLFETEVSIPPRALTLYQNYPNPFNPYTTIEYYLPERCSVRLDIYDVSGRQVICLAEGIKESGPHKVDWNGSDRSGNHVSSGVYFYKLKAGKTSIQRKMILLR